MPRTITYTFIADVDNFERPLEGAKRKAADFFGSIEKDAKRLFSGRQLAAGMKDIGSAMTTAFTLPIVAGFGAVIKASSDFDSEMTKSLAIMGPISDGMRRKMEDNARSVAKTLGVSHAEAARSYYSLASAGLSATQSMQALPQVAMFAKAGMMEMGQATDLLVSSQTALGLSFKDPVKNAQELVHVSDVLVNANNGAIGSVQAFAEALSNKSAAAMRTYHQTVEQGTAVLMAYAQAGIQGATAGERYDILLRELTSAALKHAGAFKQAKIAVFDHTGAMRPMADVIGDIEKRFAGMSDAQRGAQLELLGIKAKSQSAILGLLGMSQAIRDNEATLKAQGSTALVAQKQMQSFASQLNVLKTSVIDVAISLGQVLLPIAQKVVAVAKDNLVPAVQSAVTWFKALPPSTQDAVIGFTGLVAIAGPVVYVLGSVATTVGTVMRAVKLLMATNMAATISTWVGALAGGQGLIGVLGAAGGALSGFLAVAVPWGVAAGAVFTGVYYTVKKLIDAIPGLRPAIDMEMANVYRWATGTKGNKELEDPLQNAALGPATRAFLSSGGKSPALAAATTDAKALGDAAAKASTAVNELAANIGKPAKKGFLQEYLQELRDAAPTAAALAKAVRQSWDKAWSRSAIMPGPATSFGGMVNVFGSAGKPAGWDLPTNAYGWNQGSDYKPGIARLGDAGGSDWYNHAGQPGYEISKPVTNQLERNLQNLSNIFSLASGKIAKTISSIAGSGAGLAGGISALKAGGFGSGLTGLLGKAGAIGSIAASAFSIGSSIFSLFKGKPKEPPPPPPKEVDQATWNTHVTDQLSKGSSGLAAGVAGIKIGSVADLTAQASIAGQQFWAVFKTQGIMAAAASVKDVVGKLVGELGQYGSAAAEAILGPISQLTSLAGNEMFAGAAEGAKGFADVLASQVNARMPMSIAQFDAYGQQASAAFEQAKQAALDSGMSIEQANEAAFGATGPLIQTIIDAAAQYGITLDSNTQSLVDQAKASGIAFSTSSTDRLIMSVDALTSALGGVPPKLAAITDGVNGIPTNRQVNVDVVYHDGGGIRNPDNGGTPDPDNSFASGTGGLKDFGRSSLAVLHGREAVLTEPQYARLTAAANATQLEIAQAGSGVSLSFGDIHVAANDAAGGREAAQAFKEQLEDMLVNNTADLREMLRRRLQIA